MLSKGTLDVPVGGPYRLYLLPEVFLIKTFVSFRHEYV